MQQGTGSDVGERDFSGHQRISFCSAKEPVPCPSHTFLLPDQSTIILPALFAQGKELLKGKK